MRLRLLMNLAEIPQRRVNEFIAIAAQAAAVKPDIFRFCIKIAARRVQQPASSNHNDRKSHRNP